MNTCAVTQSNTETDTRIEQVIYLDPPSVIKHECPITEAQRRVVADSRREVEAVLRGDSNKLIVVMGPCSIHDPVAALEYAKFLKSMQERYRDTLVIIMRTYFCKPRTTVGWKGLIYDPDLNGTCNLKKGLRLARSVLLDILELGVACSMEHLDTISPQYVDDLLSWAAVGARTTESQIHRELASGISTAIGFKNGTGGSIEMAVNAVEASIHPHNFLGCDSNGNICSIRTKGNDLCHVILRGGSKGPNYHQEVVRETEEMLVKRGLTPSIVIDFSHGNSCKQHKRQLIVSESVSGQIAAGSTSIRGIMVESNLVEGNQKIEDTPLCYGKSITDACVHLEDSETILKQLSNAVCERNALIESSGDSLDTLPTQKESTASLNECVSSM